MLDYAKPEYLGHTFNLTKLWLGLWVVWSLMEFMHHIGT